MVPSGSAANTAAAKSTDVDSSIPSNPTSPSSHPARPHDPDHFDSIETVDEPAPLDTTDIVDEPAGIWDDTDDERPSRVGPIALSIGALLMIAGTMLAWVELDGATTGNSANGFDTYFFGVPPDTTEWSSPGSYILGLGVVLLLLGGRSIIGQPTRAVSTVGVALGAVGLLVTGAAWWSVRSVIDAAGAFGNFSTGIGIYVSLLGALSALAGAVLTSTREN